MAKLDDLPTAVSDAGQEHDYTNPPPGRSTLTLVTAPLAPDRRALPSSYGAFVDGEIAAGRAWVETDRMHNSPGDVARVPLSFTEASKYNYGRLAIGTRTWFIRYTPRYRNLTVTDMVPEIDGWASYPWSLGYSMVTRGHAAVAASQSDTYGDTYCDAPEPISAPPEVGVRSVPVLSSDPGDWTVLVISANDLRGLTTSTPYFEPHVENDQMRNVVDYGVASGTDGDGVPLFGPANFAVVYPWQRLGSGPVDVYVPAVKPAVNSTIDGVSAGGGVYLFTLDGFAAWLSVMQGASWVTEGIADVRLVPSWCVGGGGSGTGISDLPPKDPTDSAWAAAAAIPVYAAEVTSGTYDETVLAGWRDDYLASVGASKYRKLITSQHSAILVGNGASTVKYQPEAMRTSGVPTHATTGAAHGEASVRLAVDYNLLGDQVGSEVAMGGSAGVLTSGYSRAAANTASADLGPVNSIYTNFVSREAMERNQTLALALELEKIQMNFGIIGVQSVLSAASGAVTGAMVGSAPGAVVGAVLGGGSAAVTAGVSSNQSLDLLDVSQNGSVSIGAYQLGANGAFNAMSFRSWVQALKASSGRGQAERLASAWRAVTGQAFSVIIAAPVASKVRSLVSTWDRYGYMIGRAFTPPQLDAMSKFTYWETERASIQGQIPPEARAEIEAAFDGGVTIWTTVGQIGSGPDGNEPTAGFTY